MLTPRNVIVVVILIVVISLVSACVGLLEPPTGGVNGRDSYGTQSYGYRGLFETLEALQVPVERELTPPEALGKRDVTLAIFEPDPVIVTSEPAYLHDVVAWVKEGGTVVVAPVAAKPLRIAWPLQDWPPRNPVEELSLTSIDVDAFHPRDELSPEDAKGDASKKPEPRTTETTKTDPKTPEQKSRKPVRRRTDEAVDFALGQSPDIPVSFVHATVDGDLAARFPHGLELAVPAKNPHVITELARLPGSHVRAVLEPGGEPQIIAAIYPQERGTIAVLADPRMAENALLGRGDNAVLVAHLLADPRRPVVFDEFYHGRTVRSNPLWLATRFPYSALALAVLGTTLLVGWRAARVVGPPIPRRVPSRRTLAEYIDAMARLLNRSRHPVPYLLDELRQGLLWRMRRELALPPGRDDVKKMLQVLERRNPALAVNLREALEALDQTLQSSSPSSASPSSATVTATLAKVSRCAAAPRRPL